jgi:cobalt/nickel transport system permease protein
MAASGTFAGAEVIPGMLGIHAIIGISEAAATALVAVAAIAFTPREPCGLSRGDACLDLAASDLRPVRGLSACGFAMALIVGAFSPFASTLPDGLEYVAQTLSADERL